MVQWQAPNGSAGAGTGDVDGRETEDGSLEAEDVGLSGFLFGNVDRRGRLEADYLDRDAKAHLRYVVHQVALPESDAGGDASTVADEFTAELRRQRERQLETDGAAASGSDSDSADGGRAAAVTDSQQLDSDELGQKSAKAPAARRGRHKEEGRGAAADDYYDETEIFDDDLSEGEREHLAQIAVAGRASVSEAETQAQWPLQQRQQPPLEDEYDEVGGEAAVAPPPATTTPATPNTGPIHLILPPVTETGLVRFTRFLVPEQRRLPLDLHRRRRIVWRSKAEDGDKGADGLELEEESEFQRPDDGGLGQYPYARLVLQDWEDALQVAVLRGGDRRRRQRATRRPETSAPVPWTRSSPPERPPLAPLSVAGWRAPDSTTAADIRNNALCEQVEWEEDICWDDNSDGDRQRHPYPTPTERLLQDFHRNAHLDAGHWVASIRFDDDDDGRKQRSHSNALVGTGSVQRSAADLRAFDLQLTALYFDENDPQRLLFRIDDARVPAPCSTPPYPLHIGRVDALLRDASNDRYYGIELAKQRRRSARAEAMANLRHAVKARQAYTGAWCYGYNEPQLFHRPNVLPWMWRQSLRGPIELQPVRRRKDAHRPPHELRNWLPKTWTDLSPTSRKDPGAMYLFEYPLERAPLLVHLPGMAGRLLPYTRRGLEADDRELGDSHLVALASDDLPPLSCGDVRVGHIVTVFESTCFAAPVDVRDAPSTDFLVACTERGTAHVTAIDRLVAVGCLEPRNKPKVMIPNSDRMKRFVRHFIELQVLREVVRRGEHGVERTELVQRFPRRRVYPETAISNVLREACDNVRNRYVARRHFVEEEWPRREAALLRLITPEETCAFESMEVGWEELCARGITIFSSPSMQGNIVGAAEKAELGARGRDIALYMRAELGKTRWVRADALVRAQKALQYELRSVLHSGVLAMDILRGEATADDRLRTMTRDDALRFLRLQFACMPNAAQRAALEQPEQRVRVLRQTALDRARQRPLIPLSVQIQRLIDQHLQTTGGMSLERQLQRLRDGFPAESVAGRTASAAAAAAGLRSGRAGVDDEAEERRELLRLLRGAHPSPRPADSSAASTHASSTRPGRGYVLKRRLKITRKVDGVEQVRYIEDPAEMAAYRQRRQAREEALRVSMGGGVGFAAKSMTQSRKAGKKGTAEERLQERLDELAEASRRLNVWGTWRPPETAKRELESGMNGAMTTEGGDVAPVILPSSMSPPVPPKLRLPPLDGCGKRESVETPTAAAAAAPAKLTIRVGVGAAEEARVASPTSQPSPPSSAASAASGKIPRRLQRPRRAPSTATTDGGDAFGDPPPPSGSTHASSTGHSPTESPLSMPPLKRQRSAKPRVSKRSSGKVRLNNILREVEERVREAEGVVVASTPYIRVQRVRPGEPPPPDAQSAPAKLVNTGGIDFAAPVLDATYKKRIPLAKQMYLQRVRRKCDDVAYASADEFLHDMRLIADNARRYHTRPEAHWVVQHAEYLVEAAEEEIAHRQADIDEALRKDADAAASGRGEGEVGQGDKCLP